jgi:hypothetical protein
LRCDNPTAVEGILAGKPRALKMGAVTRRPIAPDPERGPGASGRDGAIAR